MNLTSFINKLSLLSISLLLITSCKEEAPSSPPPPKVQVVDVIKTDVPITKEFIGQTYGYLDIPIRARVQGFLTGIYFEEGSWVDKGHLLYTIDPEPYEALVAQQRSMVAEARTKLAQAESDLKRIKPLAEINAVSQRDLDAAIAQYGAAEAAVEAAKASLSYTEINLGYSKIYSPIRGVIGKTEAKVGEFVGLAPNPVVLNAVSRIDTILVQFSIAEADYLRLNRYQAEIRAVIPDSERKAGARSRIKLILADGSVFPEEGLFNFANRQVNPTTGSMMIQVSFPNPDYMLRPGQFARLSVVVDIAEDVLIIPQRSVREIQGIFQAYVVGEDNVVESRILELGPAAGSMYIVLSGLNEGEKVVFEGLQYARPGGNVDPETVEVPSKLMNY